MSAATDMLALYIAAEKAVLEGKSFSLNGRSLNREDLGVIRVGRKEWELRVQGESAISRGGSSLYSTAGF